jgi:hypothetical protein
LDLTYYLTVEASRVPMFTYPLDNPLVNITGRPRRLTLGMTGCDDQEPPYPLLNVTHPGPAVWRSSLSEMFRRSEVRGATPTPDDRNGMCQGRKDERGGEWRVASCRVVAQLPTMDSGQCRFRMLELLVCRQRQRGQWLKSGAKGGSHTRARRRLCVGHHVIFPPPRFGDLCTSKLNGYP